MDLTMDTLQSELAAMKKVPNPKVRFSFSSRRRTLKSIHMRKEKRVDNARQKAEKDALKEVKTIQSDAILSEASRKVAAKVNQGESSKHDGDSPPNEVMPAISSSDNVIDVDVPDQQPETSLSASPGTLQDDIKTTESHHEGTHKAEPNNNEDSSKAEYQLKIKEKEIEELTRQLDMAYSQAEKYRLMYDEERSKNLRNEKTIKELREEKKAVMMDIKKKVDSLPSVIQKNITKNSEECYLDDVQQFAIPLEDKFKEFTVGENEIYLGNGLKITRDDLYEIGSKSSFTSKVGALMEYFFPDGPEYYSLSGKSKYDGKVLKKISEETKENMKIILRCLPECKPVTTSKLNDALKYSTNVVRCKKWGKVGLVRAKKGQGKKRKGDNCEDNNDGAKQPKNEDGAGDISLGGCDDSESDDESN